MQKPKGRLFVIQTFLLEKSSHHGTTVHATTGYLWTTGKLQQQQGPLAGRQGDSVNVFQRCAQQRKLGNSGGNRNGSRNCQCSLVSCLKSRILLVFVDAVAFSLQTIDYISLPSSAFCFLCIEMNGVGYCNDNVIYAINCRGYVISPQQEKSVVFEGQTVAEKKRCYM